MNTVTSSAEFPTRNKIVTGSQMRIVFRYIKTSTFWKGTKM